MVCITNCKFFFAQSDAEVRRASSRYSELETNSPAACVPVAKVPAADTTNWPVLELSSLVTMPKSSITSPCGPNLGVPGAASRTLLPDHRLPILFHKCKMEVGRHLHRPPIVERPNNDGGRVAQVGEGVLAPNPDLTLLTHAAQEQRRAGPPRRHLPPLRRSQRIPPCHPRPACPADARVTAE